MNADREEDDPLFAADRPHAGQRVDELWCWVAIYENGSEGIIGGGVPGLGYVPLISSDEVTAGKLERLARAAQRAGIEQAEHWTRIELRRFVVDR